MLNYQPPAPGFATWISDFPGLSATGPDDDPDADGITNLMEYVLNGDPGSSSPGMSPDAVVSGADFIVSFVRRAESKADTTQVIQHGSTLTGWTDVPIPATTAGNVTIAPDTPAAGLETVTITLPGGPGPRFGRLSVSQP
jgi:hypothetical protein